MRALAGVAQMDHPAFEVIVVADPQAAQAVRDSGIAVKLAEYDKPNISTARNIGLRLAAAPVVAFLDDDSVPEPTWLSRLCAPFSNPKVNAAGGFVLGRSGLQWQWRAAWITGDGFDEPFDAPPETSLHPGTPTRAIKTQGTNCAFRLAPLLAIGGFDPVYSFYLDEADVNLRLAALGGLTAVVPGAVVHHGFAASARRRADRIPTDLTQIGHSLALFIARHGQSADALGRHITEQRARLLRHMISGGLEPRDVRRLMRTVHDGIHDANALRHRLAPEPITATPTAFSPLPGTGPRKGRLVFGNLWNRAKLKAAAQDAVARGEIATLVLLAPGLRPHRHRFNPGGWWEQSGGRFGRSFRDGPRFVWKSAATRRAKESARWSQFRPISDESL